MKAVQMTAVGGPEVLVVNDVPAPAAPSQREVLVKLKAAGINPADMKQRKRGTIIPGKMPAVLGFDGAGVVESIGSAVQNYKIGDEVYFCTEGLGGRDGTYAEYVSVDERYIARKPKSLSFIEAAAAPLVLITAWESLYDRVGLGQDKQVLIHAGAGGVGHVAIQLAKLRNAQVCTTVGSKESAEFVTALGADHIVYYNQGDFVEPVLKWTGGRGVDMTYDTVGGDTLSRSFHATAVYGDIVGIVESDYATTDWNTARLRNQRVSFTLMLAAMLLNLSEAREHQAWILSQCADLFDSGKLKIQASKTFALAEAAEAHRALEKGSVRGKIVLEI